LANILIIDDDPVYSGMLQQRLSRAKHNVNVHLGPFGGTLAARRPGIDLVILDVFMPGLDGPALLELMRRDGLPSRQKVIFCSSMDPEPLRELAERHRADGWVPKSAARQELLDCVDRVLGPVLRAHNTRPG
jgi:DNA-binding response OmpR family regulator